MRKKNPYRFLFAGGGTGGHLYPAIAVADKIKELLPDADILFIGTKHKIESSVVPKLGYKFKSIWINGFSRKFNVKNMLFPFKVIISMLQSLTINFSFQPRVAIGTGAYVSGPAIWAASFMGAKIMLLEQNSYPGITNRLLEKKADEVHIAFEDSKKYFRFNDKLYLTGNLVRTTLKLDSSDNAKAKFDLDKIKKTLVVLGGSLGALSINEAVAENISKLIENEIQILWQTGKYYFDKYSNLNQKGAVVIPFAENMSDVYSVADLVLCRAGATTIAEVAALGLPVIFVPSSNVAANHQYKNAKSIEEKNAAIVIKDEEIKDKFLEVVLNAINDKERLTQLQKNIKEFSNPKAVETIAKNAIKFAEVI